MKDSKSPAAGNDLGVAVWGGNLAEVQQLLRNGADVNAPVQVPMCGIAHTPHYPLHYACYRGYDAIVRELVANGASMTAGDADRSYPLAWAAYAGRTDTVKLMLELGADPNAQDVWGYSAGDHAANNEVRRVIKDHKQKSASLQTPSRIEEGSTYKIINSKDSEFLYACRHTVMPAGGDQTLISRMIATQEDSSDGLAYFDATDKWQFEPRGDSFLIRNMKDGEYLYAARHLAQSSYNEAGDMNRDLCRRMVTSSSQIPGDGSALWKLQPVGSDPCRFYIINELDQESLYACRHMAQSATSSDGSEDLDLHRRMVSTAEGPFTGCFEATDVWRIVCVEQHCGFVERVESDAWRSASDVSVRTASDVSKCFSGPTPDPSNVQEVESDDEFERVVRGAGEKAVIVDFFATWCPPCQFIGPKFVDLAQKYPEALFVKVDVDRNEATAERYDVSAMPTFIAIKDGMKVGSVVGADVDAVEALVKKVQSHKELSHADMTLAEPVEEGRTSENSDTPILVRVLNDTQHTVVFEWVDYDGTLVHYASRGHWEIWIQPTYKSHPWRLTDMDSGTELARVRFTGNVDTSVSKLMQLNGEIKGASDIKAVANQCIIFEAANVSYGLSAKDCDQGKQLKNTRADNDGFHVRPEGDHVYKFESSSGLYLGVGEPHQMWYPNDGFQAVLVPKDHPSAAMRVLPARNGAEGFHSFESVEHPGYLLNHCDGKIWFFNGPANNELVFSQDASWQLLDKDMRPVS